MADYISRDTILEKLNKKFCAYCPLPDCDTNCKLHYLLDAVKEEPAADVRPVVRARWEDATGYIFSNLAQRVRCPVCKSYAYFHAIMPRNYCPNCGAEMGVQKDD